MVHVLRFVLSKHHSLNNIVMKEKSQACLALLLYRRTFMGFTVLSDETLEDLQLKGLYIIQKKNTFRFGTDAVLLSSFVARDRKSVV